MATVRVTTRLRFITGRDADDREMEMVFDATFKESHKSTLEVTEEPVGSGVSLTDHCYMKPNTFTLEVGVSDTPLLRSDIDRTIPSNQLASTFTGAGARSVNAFEALCKLQASGIPCNYQSGLKLYENVLITAINVEQVAGETDTVMVATVECKEVIFATVESVTIPPRAPKKAKPKKVEVKKKAEEPKPTEVKPMVGTLKNAANKWGFTSAGDGVSMPR